jgi:hypothetical protein
MAATRSKREPIDMTNAETATLALLVACVVGSALAIGSVHLVTLCVVAAVAIGAACCAMAIVTPGRVFSPPLAIVVTLVLFTMLQALPLPVWLVERVAPQNADIWARAFFSLHEGRPAFVPISVDPGATVREALKGFVYITVFISASILAARRGVTPALMTVYGAGVLIAIVTLLHGLLGLQEVYGFYTPRTSLSPWHVSPFINSNNLAGYLNLGALCGFGLIGARTTVAVRWLLATGVTLLLAVDVLAASRGGFVALALGILAYMCLSEWRLRMRRASHRCNARYGLGATILGSVGLAALAARPQWGELAERDLDKLRMLRAFMPLVRDYFLVGAGRGAFESVSPGYAMPGGNYVYAYAENVVVQWAAEWGVPVSTCAFMALAWLYRPRSVGVHRDRRAAAAWLAVMVVLVQNLFDLGLEVPGLTIPVVLLLGSLWGSRVALSAPGGAPGKRLVPPLVTAPAQRPTGPAEFMAGKTRRSAASVATGLVLASAGVALVLGALYTGWYDVERDQRELSQTYRAGTATPMARAHLRSRIRASILRHPAEPYFPLIAALVAMDAQDESPFAWLGRTLERAPGHARAHLALAWCLASRGAVEQALLELRSAIVSDPSVAPLAARQAVKITGDLGEIVSVAPEGAAGAAYLAEASERTAPTLRLAVARAAVEHDGESAEAHWARGGALVAELTTRESDACRAANERCRHELDESIRALETLEPHTTRSIELRARAMLAEGRAEEAESVLRAVCQGDRMLECLRLRVTAALATQDPTRSATAIQALMSAGCNTPSICASTATWAGDQLMSNNDPGRASGYYERATREEPSETRWLKLADAASRTGAHGRAIDALERLAATRRDDRVLEQRIADERARAVGEILR